MPVLGHGWDPGSVLCGIAVDFFPFVLYMYIPRSVRDLGEVYIYNLRLFFSYCFPGIPPLSLVVLAAPSVPWLLWEDGEFFHKCLRQSMQVPM